jgi:ribosomal protein L40E
MSSETSSNDIARESARVDRPSPKAKRRELFLAVFGGVGAAITIFFVVLLWYYNFRPTVGTFVLALGWVALLGAAYLLVRSAMSFDLSPVPDTAPGGIDDDRRAELEREKKTLLKAIKEIEFDEGMGKIEANEAKAAIDRYRARAIEILKLLEPDTRSAEYQETIEKELAKRLARAEKQADKAPKKVDPHVCPSCGLKNDTDASFCKKCGTKVGGAS